LNLKRGTVRHDAFLLLAGGMIVRLCGLLFVVVLARVLSERQIGIFSFAEALADLLILIASFNLDSLIVRRIAAGPPSEVTRRFAPLLGFRLVSAPVYLLVICGVALFTHSEQRWVLPVVGLCTLMESLYICLSDMFVGTSQPAVRAKIEVVAELTFSAAFVLAMWVRPTMGSLIEVSLIRGFMLVGVVLYLIRARFGRLHVAWDNSLLVAGIPFLLMTFLSILQGKIETVLLGVLSNYETVGVFQLALRLILAAQFIPQAAASALYPRLAGGGWNADNRRRLLRGLAGLIGLGFLGCAFLLIFRSPLTRLIYGAKASQVSPVLKAMAPLLPFRFAAAFAASVLTAVGRERAVLCAMICGTIAGLTADVLLIPRMGAVGASIGLFTTALSQCIFFGVILFGATLRSASVKSPVKNVDPRAATSIAELPI
jgi:O-antigen/teichoic acid export membrane protein